MSKIEFQQDKNNLSEKEFYEKYKGEKLIFKTKYIKRTYICDLIGYFDEFESLVLRNNDCEESQWNSYEEIEDMIPDMTLCETIKQEDIITFAYLDEILDIFDNVENYNLKKSIQ